MADFCTLEDLEAALGMDAADPNAATLAIRDVSDAIKGFLGQSLVFEDGRVVTLTALPYRDTVVLPVSHVRQITSVVEDGTTLAVDTDYRYSFSGLLWRMGGGSWSTKVHGIIVTLNCGHPDGSDEANYLRSIAVSASLRRYQNALRSAVAGGASGVQSESMPDYQISYGVDLGGAYSMLLLPSERDMLRARFSKGVG